MRLALTAAVVSVILAATALDLRWGAAWILATLGLGWLRRRVRLVPALAMIGAASLALLGVRGGWLVLPPLASYVPEPPAPAHDATSGARDGEASGWRRLHAVREEELVLSPTAIGERAARAIALARRAAAVRARAPAETADLEAATARLALTLTSAEFRDLEGRQHRLRAWLDDLERQLRVARDEGEAEVIDRALAPAALASVSLRAVREDLARAEAAGRDLVRALGRGPLEVTASSTLRYDETLALFEGETRYVASAAWPLRVLAVDARAVARGPGDSVRVDLPPAPGPGMTRAVVVVRFRRPAVLAPVRSPWRRLAFVRAGVRLDETAPGPLPVTVGVDPEPGLEGTVALPLPPPALSRLVAPRHALHWTSLPGSIETTGEADVWTPAPGHAVPARLLVELRPPTWLLRNRAFGGLAPWVYGPGPIAALIVLGLGGATVALLPRRRTRDREGADGRCGSGGTTWRR